MASDPLEDGARLIDELGACYARARRYRALAATCEERFLGRALAIGDVLREWSRDGEVDADTSAAALGELRDLVAACAAAIATVRASASYREAVAAWNAERWHRVAELAPEIFDAIEPLASAPPLHLAVGVTAPRGGAHFLPPATVAERIAGLARSGLSAADPVPELGADETLRAVVFDDDPEAVETPITLVVEPGDVPWPLFRLAPVGEVFVYVPRLAVPMRVRAAPRVADEWWAVRPDAYQTYVAELARELAGRGIAELARG